jgi:hypothetical protein
LSNNDVAMTTIQHRDEITSRSMADFDAPGIVVELDPDEADQLGAFEETALTEEEAWAANMDVEPG